MEESLLSLTEQESLRLALLELEHVEEVLRRRRRERGIDYFIPNIPQSKALLSPARTIAYCGANRVGKTTLGAAFISAHLSKIYPSCACHGEWFSKEHRFQGPVKAAICVTKFDKIEQVIEPKLFSVLPKDFIARQHRTPQGYLRRLQGKDGSVLDILTNEMDQMAFESTDWDVVWIDEPLPKSHYQGIRRGLADRMGLCMLTFTPMVEPWMKEDIVDQADGRRIEVIKADTYQNLQDIHGNPILTREAVQDLELSLPEDVRRTRIYGEFFHLRGLVYTEYNSAIHEKEWEYFKGDYKGLSPDQLSFGYPDPVICVLDPHDRLPHHAIWAVVDRTDWLYVDRELVFQGNLQELKKAVLWTEQQAGYHVVRRLIDPNFGNKPAEVGGGRTVRQELSRLPFSCPFGLANDDKEAGRMKVKDFLHFNPGRTLDITNSPKIFFHRQRVPVTIRSLRNYQYDEWKGAGKDDKDPKEREKQKDTHGSDCFDQETEVLTSDGWKRFSQVKVGDPLMAASGSYQPCVDVIAYPYSGEMIHINAPHVDLVMTPNHRMLVERTRGLGVDFCRAGDLKVSHRIPIALSSYGSYLNGSIDIPPIWTEDGRRWENEKHIPSKLWSEFIGWFISEGSTTGSCGGKVQIPGRGYQVIISQNPGKKADKIADLLTRMGYRFNFYGGRNFVVSNKQLWSMLHPLGNCYTKYIPRSVMNLDQECLNALWGSLVDGDGWRIPSDGIRQEREIYATVSERLASDVQELLLKLGYSSSISKRLVPPCRLHGEAYTSVPQFYVYKNIGKWAVMRDSRNDFKVSHELYQGMVYCATVPDHTLMVRRNRKPVLTGNCIRYLCMSNPTFDGLMSLRNQEPDLVEVPY